MNKSSVPAMAAVCGVMLHAGTASADFVMLTVELFANNWNTSDAELDGNIPDGNLRDLWRVYAHFSMGPTPARIVRWQPDGPIQGVIQ